MSLKLQQITILGSTGSIGVSTLDVIARHPDRFSVYALTASTSVDALYEQCCRFRPRFAVMADADAAAVLERRLRDSDVTKVLHGDAGLRQVAESADVDAVMAAIVGSAGLPPTLAAAQAGKRVLLANKEALVMAGALFMSAVHEANALLMPIDSEHNAIFQCLPVSADGRPGLRGVERILLTASGGPFRSWSEASIQKASPDQACAHPNWDMGRKISVDSASLMNKGLELAEACWLFDVSPDQVDIVVHPQSIIHSMVQYQDGSVLAQLGNPDMRTPIAYGLAWPERIMAGVAPLDMINAARLDFEAPDEGRFPCLRIAREAIAAGGTAMVSCNAANEVAVAGFLDGQLGFTDIPRLIEATLEQVPLVEPSTLPIVEQADTLARDTARALLARMLARPLGDSPGNLPDNPPGNQDGGRRALTMSSSQDR
ncbi:MAG: 1-deoxy-D-xylulose-5-phosphate reductoisomerase [Chromatocurvus sp.]